MKGVDEAYVGSVQGAHDRMNWRPVWCIDKFHDPDDIISRKTTLGVPLSAVLKDHPSSYRDRTVRIGNSLLNSGINVAWGLICGAGGAAFDDTHAYIGVGDSATATVPSSMTGLQASTNKLNKGMNATYPLAAAAQAEVWQSTFGTTDANWIWNEITVSNANDFTHALNRLVSSMGTKASGATWVVTLTITLS